LTALRRIARELGSRWLRLLFLLPLAYLLRPIFWTPLDDRFYNFFHSLRPVPPWTRVAVAGIDRATRDSLFAPPVLPLSRHEAEHARLVRRLSEAGAAAIVFDLELGADSYAAPPETLAAAFRASGRVDLVGSLSEEERVGGQGRRTKLLAARLPDSLLLASARGAFGADVDVDPDGVVRRFDADPRLARLGLESLPEHLAGRRVRGRVPILFPSVARPIPVVSYREVWRGAPAALSALRDRIVFVGLVDDPSHDFVSVPRQQDLGRGVRAYGLPGVVTLAAITETLLRGAPLRDAGTGATLAWTLLWCALTLAVLPRRRPSLAALVLVGLVLAAATASGAFHAAGGLVFPAGLTVGAVFLCGLYGLIAAYARTSRELHVEELENLRVRQEMETARRTQERFLPREIPRVPGLDLWGANLSSAAVSGDYFDVIDLGPERPLLVAIADVAGKGMPAALLMSNVQAGLHSQTAHEPFDPALTVRNLNVLVHRNVEPGSFVTLFLGALDKQTHRLRYVRAGHDHPILARADGSVRTLDQGSFFLGLLPDVSYDAYEVALVAGDALCLYTDGVTEARDPAGEEFGLERLTALLRENRERSAETIGRAIIERVRAFSRLERQADDVTLVVLRVEEAP
jgi:serine phosphatase RsbU (regulator of sigma subunit)/CHASE2 domain-containing sensor protein